MRSRVISFLIALLGCVASIVAQETTGEIAGKVKTSDGQRLPGVTITLADQETGSSRSAVVGGEGTFHLGALRPADYELTATLDGFQTSRRNVHVDLGSSVNVDIEMNVGAFTDMVEVTGEAPMINMTSATTGITLDAASFTAKMPLTRDVTQLSLLAPGTVPGAAVFENGATSRQLNTPGQSLVSFNGSSIAENSYIVNGLNITSLREMMGSTFVPMEFVQEVQVKTGGYEAEFGRSTGGVVNLVTKRGTNAFRGGLSVYSSPKGLQGHEPDALEREYDGSVVVSQHNQDEENSELEVNGSLGGPIVADKLFFFGFLRYNDSDNLQIWDYDAQRQSSSQPYWGGKLDWSISQDHRLEGTYINDKVDVDVVGYNFDPETRAIVDVRDTGMQYRGGDNYILRYSGILTGNLLLAAQHGRNEFDRTTFPDGADACPYARDSRSGRSRSIGCYLERTVGTDGDARTASRFDVDWYVGNHGLRAGVDFENNQSMRDSYYSGGVSYTYYINGDRYEDLPEDTELVRVTHSSEKGTYDASSNAAYVQDSWSLTANLTVNFGVRWESFENKNIAGETFLKVNDQFAPRLGAVWDVDGDGRSKLYGSFGVYHLPMSTKASLLLGNARVRDEGWYVLEGGINPNGSPVALGEELQYQITDDGRVRDPRETVDDNIDPMSQTELILGYQRMVGANWSVGVRGVAREFNEVIEDILIDKAMWETHGIECFNPDNLGTSVYSSGDDSCAHDFRLTNPGTDFNGWFDLDGDGVLDPIHLPAEVIGMPEAVRDYYAVELTFARRFADRWMLRGSYTWSHSYGNYEGMVTSDFGQALPYFTKTFDVAALTEHADGNLPNDRRHIVKLFGVYAFDAGFQVGGNLWYRSGRPVNGFGMHPTDPWAQWYGVKAFYNNGVPCPRGCAGTTPDAWSLDVMAKYDFRIGGFDWFARLDVFNAFDNDATLEVNEEAEDTSFLANPSYLMARYYQSPRSVRLGFGMTF